MFFIVCIGDSESPSKVWNNIHLQATREINGKQKDLLLIP